MSNFYTYGFVSTRRTQWWSSFISKWYGSLIVELLRFIGRQVIFSPFSLPLMHSEPAKWAMARLPLWKKCSLTCIAGDYLFVPSLLMIRIWFLAFILLLSLILRWIARCDHQTLWPSNTWTSLEWEKTDYLWVWSSTVGIEIRLIVTRDYRTTDL